MSIEMQTNPVLQGGFTLLEALIGFMILSIGMLGIASLQAISLKAGKTSVYGSVAMMKVEQLFESMRANPTALSSYTGSGVDNGCSAANCTAEKLAEDDLYWWKKDMKAGLPAEATSTVTYSAPLAPSKMATMTVTINWSERDEDSTGSIAKTYTTSTNICMETPC